MDAREEERMRAAIPEGWRLLTEGEWIRQSDLYWSRLGWWSSASVRGKWDPSRCRPMIRKEG